MVAAGWRWFGFFFLFNKNAPRAVWVCLIVRFMVLIVLQLSIRSFNTCDALMLIGNKKIDGAWIVGQWCPD